MRDETPNERVVLTRAMADQMMKPGDHVHTLVEANGAGNVLLGADWPREDILAMADQGKVELAGELATKMNHGIVAHHATGPVFVATQAIHVQTVVAEKCRVCGRYFDKSECPHCAALNSKN